MSELRRTPFYELQAAAGARFVPFAGYDMPVQFAGVVAEHKAVRAHAGLFDVSHMGEFLLKGEGAEAALQHLVTNDVTRMGNGDAQYTVMCRPDGGIVDDLICYRVAEGDYFLVVNASRRDEDLSHMHSMLKEYAAQDSGQKAWELHDVSDDWAQLALQGPTALEVLAAVSDIDIPGLKPFTFVDATVAGVDNVRVARTGYTGEDGVELYCASNDGARLWQGLMAAGKPHQLVPCGLGCRDTLRLEMKYALYGNDIDDAHNPYEAGLGWVVKLGKGPFVGSEVLAAIKERGAERKLVGFKMRARGIPRHGYSVCADGAAVGVVTSGTHSPSLGEPIGLAYVPKKFAAVGSQLDIEIRGKMVPAEVVKTPFYKRES